MQFQSVAGAYADSFQEFIRDLEQNNEDKVEDIKQSILKDQLQPTDAIVQQKLVESFKALVKKNVEQQQAMGEHSIAKLTQKYRQHQVFLELIAARWREFNEDRSHQYEKQVENYVASKLFYKGKLSQYKQEVIRICTEVVNKSESKNWNLETRKAEFNKIFAPILAQVKEQHPLISERIEQEVRKVFGSTKYTIKSMPDMLETEPITASRRGYMGNTIQYLGTFQQGTEARQMFEYLNKVTHFEDKIVRKVLGFTLWHLENQKNEEEKNRVLKDVYKLLINDITKLQQDWENDKGNSVYYLLLRDEDVLFQLFDGGCARLTATQQLERLLKLITSGKYLRNALINKVGELVIGEMKQNMSKYAWVWKAENPVVQVMADLDLLELLVRDRDEDLIEQLKNPSTHYDNMVLRYLRHVAQHAVSSKNPWKELRQGIKRAIRAVVSTASNQPRKLESFLRNLKKAEEMPLSLIAAVDSIYGTMEDYFDALNDAPEVFEDIAREVIEALSKSNPTTDYLDEAVSAVWKDMVEQREGTGLQVRCNAVCTYCGLPCHKQRSHFGEHSTHHQPCGLAGTYYQYTRMLCDISCVDIVQKKLDFIFKLQCYKSTDWQRVFPNWAIPTPSIRLRVRELIFFYKQDLLLTRHNTRMFFMKRDY